jgi:hypothetical protein
MSSRSPSTHLHQSTIYSSSSPTKSQNKRSTKSSIFSNKNALKFLPTQNYSFSKYGRKISHQFHSPKKSRKSTLRKNHLFSKSVKIPIKKEVTNILDLEYGSKEFYEEGRRLEKKRIMGTLGEIEDYKGNSERVILPKKNVRKKFRVTSKKFRTLDRIDDLKVENFDAKSSKILEHFYKKSGMMVSKEELRFLQRKRDKNIRRQLRRAKEGRRQEYSVSSSSSKNSLPKTTQYQNRNRLNISQKRVHKNSDFYSQSRKKISKNINQIFERFGYKNQMISSSENQGYDRKRHEAERRKILEKFEELKNSKEKKNYIKTVLKTQNNYLPSIEFTLEKRVKKKKTKKNIKKRRISKSLDLDKPEKPKKENLFQKNRFRIFGKVDLEAIGYKGNLKKKRKKMDFLFHSVIEDMGKLSMSATNGSGDGQEQGFFQKIGGKKRSNFGTKASRVIE